MYRGRHRADHLAAVSAARDHVHVQIDLAEQTRHRDLAAAYRRGGRRIPRATDRGIHAFASTCHGTNRHALEANKAQHRKRKKPTDKTHGAVPSTDRARDKIKFPLIIGIWGHVRFWSLRHKGLSALRHRSYPLVIRRMQALATSFFLQMAVILVACRIVGWLARRIGQPQVVGEMIAGVLIGPSLLGSCFPKPAPG